MADICDGNYVNRLKCSDLFEEDIIKNVDNVHLTECANIIFQLICSFKGATNFIYNIVKQHREYQEKIQKLENQNKILQKCQNCVILKTKLNDHNKKIQTLASVFGQFARSNEETENIPNGRNDLERIHDIFTQIIDEGSKSDANITSKESHGKRKLQLSMENISNENVSQKCDENLKFEETPKKKIKVCRYSPTKSPRNVELNEENSCSPILGKSKRNFNVSFGDNTKSPLANLSNRLADKLEKSSPNVKKSEPLEKCVKEKESSPSLLEKISDADKTPSPKQLLVQNLEEAENGVENLDEKRSSLSLLQNNKPAKLESSKHSKRQQSPKSKKFKQARLSFSKAKTREPVDVSMLNNFHGGVRRFSMDKVVTKDDEDEMLKIALQLSLKETSNANLNSYEDDVIDASPADKPKPKKQHKKHRVQVQVHREPTPVVIKTEPNEDTVNVSDNEETMIFDSQDLYKRKSPLKRTKRESKRTTSMNISKSDRSHNTSPVVEPECPYVEPVVRKKVEKKNLQGWSCKKCKDFYECAFEGNEQMLKEKMNDCSKHRGKFNPIRMDTPAGFWDLRMPPTQDTEAYNKRNNKT